jgi:hypothetical protein
MSRREFDSVWDALEDDPGHRCTGELSTPLSDTGFTLWRQ